MQAWEITRKDLLLLSRDYRALIILVMFPLIFITIIGVTTGQLMVWGDEQQKLKIVMVDEVDYDAIRGTTRPETARMRRNARRFIVETVEALQRREGLLIVLVDREYGGAAAGLADQGGARSDSPWSAEALRQAVLDTVNRGDAHAAIFFGPEFFARVEELSTDDFVNLREGTLAGGIEHLDVRIQSRQPGSGRESIIKGQVDHDVFVTLAPYVFCKHRLFGQRPGLRHRCEEYNAAADPDAPLQQPRPPVETGESAEGVAGNNEVYQVMIPGFTVMFVFFLVNLMARSFIHERDLGTLRRLRLAPVTPAALLVGKTVPFYLVSLVQTSVLFGAGKLLFDMSWGEEPLYLLPIIATTSLAATGLGLLVATLVRTDSQVSAYSNLVVITLAGISGCFMPRDWLPVGLQQVSMATPHAWALIAYDQLLNSPRPDLATVWKSSGLLFGFAVLFFTAGCLRFRRQQ